MIDGLLDPGLETLPERSFSFVWKSSPANAVVPASYRLAYGTDYLYVCIETPGDSLVFRDRAYQNGDGFALLIGAARPDGEPTDEFYVLACSAVDRPQMEWSRTVFWYYNVDHLFRSTGPETRMQARAAFGRLTFELYLPWSDVRPYHPWIGSEIGFALTFTRAVGDHDRNIHLLLGDEIGAENSPRRYARLEFERPVRDRGEGVEASAGGEAAVPPRPEAATPGAPTPGSWPQTFLSVIEGHAERGDSVRLEIATASPRPFKESLMVHMLSGEGERLAHRAFEYDGREGMTRIQASFPLRESRPGGYRLAWQSLVNRDSHGEWGLTVLPRFSRVEALARLHTEPRGPSRPQGISKETATTLEFFARELADDLARLRSYETAAELRLREEDFEAMLEQAERGVDPFATRAGFMRRAFRSAIDDSLQPYGVLVPSCASDAEGVEAAGLSRPAWPIVVFLHGSGMDETDVRGFSFVAPEGVLAVAPLGRGRSNAYATEPAQIDIEEALTDAARAYGADSARVVIAGFSMGGYGALRTFWEHPERYAGVAVFAGHPDLGRRYLHEEGPPNFLDDSVAAVFRGVPVFVYHGERDQNLPFRDAMKMVEQLRRAGAKVEVRTEAGKGHEQPGPETIEAYRRWLSATWKIRR